MICKIGKSLAEIENFLKEKYIQEMVLYRINPICPARSLGPPHNADFIEKLQIKLMWY